MRIISKYFMEVLVLLMFGCVMYLATSCQKDDLVQQSTQQPIGQDNTVDCDCDAVVSITTFNVGNTSFGDYVTQNECTNVTGGASWNDVPPSIGDCL